ncbi:hypothetical protein BpHYR1_031092 [Brachionus plicatilis]|uniref:Uncharacterized protein n=1 Tax=Brachionus plicatilis TaxID=10195 RepID=A0A3M7RHJ5_BRAPC|nr:hypothetical protein BpHYR1_031092 [Brachionus plicatilis]
MERPPKQFYLSKIIAENQLKCLSADFNKTIFYTSTKGTKGYLYNYFLCRNDLAEYLIAWHTFDTLYSSLGAFKLVCVCAY